VKPLPPFPMRRRLIGDRGQYTMGSITSPARKS
jgi:hypothetical protein